MCVFDFFNLVIEDCLKCFVLFCGMCVIVFIALYSIVLYCIVLYCIVLHCTVLCCPVMRCSTLLSGRNSFAVNNNNNNNVPTVVLLNCQHSSMWRPIVRSVVWVISKDSSVFILNLKLKVLRSIDTSVTVHQSTIRNIPEDPNLQQHRY